MPQIKNRAGARASMIRRKSALPSVTRILKDAGLSTDYSQIPPDILEYARQRGEAIHLAAEYFDAGDLDESSLDPAIRNYVMAYIQFTRDTGATPVGVEELMDHPVAGFRGKADWYGHMNAQCTLIDRKATALIDVPYVSLQCAAYAMLIEHNQPAWRNAARFALHLRKDGRYKLVPVDLPAADATWLAALAEATGRGDENTRAIIEEWKERNA